MNDRKKLEAKSRLYEKIAESKGVSEHDGSKGFLVDFEQKSIRRVSDKREQVLSWQRFKLIFPNAWVTLI